MRTLIAAFSLVVMLGCGLPVFGQGGFEVTVHNTGRSPRVGLVYEVPGGQRETMSMRVELEQSLDMGGTMTQQMVLPAMVVDVGIEVADEAAEGTIEARFVFGAIGLEGRDGVPDEMTAALTQALGGFAGVSGTLVMDTDGRVIDLSVEVGDGAPAFFQESLSQIVNAFRGAITPLPGVPVGLGASWTVGMDIDLAQFTMRQEMLYTLERIDGDEVTLSVQIGQSAPGAGAIEDVKGEWENEIGEVAGGGGGTVVLSLVRVSPVRTDVTVENVVVIDSKQAGGGVAKSVVESKVRVVTEGLD